MAQDTIYIRNLRAETVIGIYGWEQEVRQVVSMDLDISADAARAAKSDCIDDSINYKSIAKRLLQMIEQERFQLVETVAERAAALVREEFGVSWVRVRVSKPGALRHADDVGIIIERGSRS